MRQARGLDWVGRVVGGVAPNRVRTSQIVNTTTTTITTTSGDWRRRQAGLAPGTCGTWHPLRSWHVCSVRGQSGAVLLIAPTPSVIWWKK
ncbi:hypothetical protein E2C01_056256 [Portunus trituberculatus]|uniref:Uncharacterized protein n=1 Tax=Portunus trituberculatus TaxID=210409 RepID=A0A5B7GWW0_PORTR|nr:hypothetical protein [Portunus trituberculatus]